MAARSHLAHLHPHPSEDNAFLTDHVTLLRQSLLKLTGRDLVDSAVSDEEAARIVFFAPLVVLSHNTDDDPVLTYCNRAGLDLFELSWEEMVAMPSRFTAEALERQERERLLARVSADGFIDDYAGVRISKNGRRFRIENATVWNLLGQEGQYKGQAATFSRWILL